MRKGKGGERKEGAREDEIAGGRRGRKREREEGRGLIAGERGREGGKERASDTTKIHADAAGGAVRYTTASSCAAMGVAARRNEGARDLLAILVLRQAWGGGAWASSFLTIRTLAVLLSPFSFHYFPTSRTIFYYQFHFLKIQANAFFQKQRNTPVPFLQLMLPNYYFDDHNCFIDNEIRLLKFRHCN